MEERIFIIACGFVLDLIFGDPLWLWHPVMGMGKVISWSDRVLRKLFGIREEREADRAKKRAAGVLLAVITLSVSIAVPALILYGAGLIHPWLRTGISCVMCYQMLALKSLRTESMKVYRALRQEGLEPARKAVSMIVGRDTQSLDREGITKAAVETIAENTSDGVIAPLLYMLLFGVLGGFFYKAVNTMDSMVGYKNDKWRYMGTAAAKLDDIVNFIPARIAAAAMIGAAFFLRLDYKNAARIYKRDRYQHASPNSAQTEAVCAGALGVQLAGDAYYFGQLYHKPTIGDAGRRVEAEDIKRANRLLYGTSLIVLAAGLLGLTAVMVLLGR
ncbi:MAG: adenosylcobinamide-phosphate synthase CbiB [Eubacteriales bacterium]|nr:adenosylcobinamide-phosphate synthase CbiB [Eubacteriales bacterium]